jgi:hypothetical protein
MSFYKKKLSEIFKEKNSLSTVIRGGDIVSLVDRKNQKNFPFGWEYDTRNNVKKDKIFYSIGCSWLQSRFSRVILNDYPNYFHINKAIGGMGNSMMIDLVKEDLILLENMPCDVLLLVSFSEVGRNKKDLSLCNANNFDYVNQYLGEILKEQYKKISEMLKNKTNIKPYITTSFVPNNFNSNKSIIDFTEGGDNKPFELSFNLQAGFYEIINKVSSGLNIKKDLDILEETRKWMYGRTGIDDTLHIDRYEPYEKFCEHILSH